MISFYFIGETYGCLLFVYLVRKFNKYLILPSNSSLIAINLKKKLRHSTSYKYFQTIKNLINEADKEAT